MIHYQDDTVTLYHGDAADVARGLPSGAVDCIVTSPPYYGLRDYGVEGQYGMEASPIEYVGAMRELFAELRRVLANDGTLWLNIGDTYSTKLKGSGGTGKQMLDSPDRQKYTPRQFDCAVPEKNLLGIPWRVAFALQDDGWILRNAIVWNKPNAMPESAKDRLSGRYEHVFLFSKAPRYWFDVDPIRVTYNGDRAGSRRARNGHTNKPNSVKAAWSAESADVTGRNPGDVWDIATQPFPGAHFATMPVALASRCVLAGCKPGGTVLDPFNGSGTTGLAAQQSGRRYVGIDLNAEYLDLTLRTRLQAATLDFEGTTC